MNARQIRRVPASMEQDFSVFLFIIPPVQHQPYLRIMDTAFNYTAIVAPVAYFILSIVAVLAINKFIGKGTAQK